MAQIKKTPALRFKAFEEEWMEKKLGEIAEIVGGGTPSTINPDYWNGNINWYSPTEIGNSVYASESVKKISQLGLEKSSATILPPNRTVLFTSRAGIGYMAILLTPGATNQGFQSIVLRENFDTYFIYSIGFLIKEFALKYSTGSTFLEISGKTLGRMPINVPSTFEQIQIGNYFKTLDELIALQKQKHIKLKQLKNAMLEKMFPKVGVKVPEIRFKGFTEDWEEKRLGDLSLDFSYGLNAASTEFDGFHKYLRITDIDDDNRLFSTRDLTSPNIDLCKADYYILQKGDILFARTGASVGKTYHYTIDDGRVYFAGFLIRARILQDYDSEFVFQSTLRNDYDSFVRVTSQRSGQPGINAKEYSNYVFKIPSLPEQQKIGAYFEKLDKSIEVNQQQIEKYKHIKQALLSKMFV